jgi:hypothetical protein
MGEMQDDLPGGDLKRWLRRLAQSEMLLQHRYPRIVR